MKFSVELFFYKFVQILYQTTWTGKTWKYKYQKNWNKKHEIALTSEYQRGFLVDYRHIQTQGYMLIHFDSPPYQLGEDVG